MDGRKSACIVNSVGMSSGTHVGVCASFLKLVWIQTFELSRNLADLRHGENDSNKREFAIRCYVLRRFLARGNLNGTCRPLQATEKNRSVELQEVR